MHNRAKGGKEGRRDDQSRERNAIGPDGMCTRLSSTKQLLRPKDSNFRPHHCGFCSDANTVADLIRRMDWRICSRLLHPGKVPRHPFLPSSRQVRTTVEVHVQRQQCVHFLARDSGHAYSILWINTRNARTY